MSQEQEIQKYTEYFRAFGASDPEAWAHSQVEEGIPQYDRFVFLHQAWQHIITDGDISWIESFIEQAERYPRDPGAGIGPALKRMLALGVERADIAEVVRVMQWQVLAGLTYQLADPSIVEYPLPDMPHVEWALFAVDEEGNSLHPIDSLHESVLDTDPTGREMRPRGVTRAG
jgi:hypothetical protein